MEEYIKMPINGYHTDEPVYTILDAEDYIKVSQWKWQQSSKGYARRNKMTTLPDGKKLWRVLQLHRVILGIEDEEMDGFCVDHINGNRLDNRKSNLRIVTLSANSSNRHEVISSTGELCVSEVDGRYIARVQREHESFYLGSFATVAEASTAVALFDEKRERVKVIRKVRTVEQLDMQGNHVNWYSSNAEAQRRTGINKTNISRCTKGERATAGGFKWRYADV